MVAFNEAGLKHYTEASRSEKAVETRKRLAKYFTEAGITKPETAVSVIALSNGDWGIARPTLYEYLRSSPGFAECYLRTGRKGYYFEADLIKPYAMRQGEEYYPRDLSAMGYEVFEAVPANNDKPLYRVKQETGRVTIALTEEQNGFDTLPVNLGMEFVSDLLSSKEAKINNPQRTLASAINALVLLYKREYVDGIHVPEEELE